jgi:hypothetical protein
MVNFWRRRASLTQWIHGAGGDHGYSAGHDARRILGLAEESGNNRSLRERSLFARCSSMTLRLIE